MHTSRARICLIAPEFIGPFPNGGVGTACYWEARTLASAGYDVTVLYTGPTERETPAHWEAMYAEGPFAYVDLWRWAERRDAAAVEPLRQPCAEAHTAELVFRFLRERAFDLLLFQEFLGHGSRTLQARRSLEALADVPAAVTLHSCRQWIYEGMQRLPSCREDLYVDFLERESARLADHVVAPSRHMARWAGDRWRLDGPAAVIPYCYDERLQRPAGVVEHRGPFTHLVFFGRLETRKGLHLFCRALADNPDVRRGLTRVTFLGKNSSVEGRPSDEYIRSTLGRLDGIDLRILSDLGSVEALAWLDDQRHALVVAPSIVDNLPYALIELFSRRLPLLSTRVGGIPEIVGGSNGHLLAEPTADGLAALLAEVQRRGSLTIDYRDGYSIAASNAAHVAWVESMLADAQPVQRTSREACRIVLVDARRDTLEEARRVFVERDPGAASCSFLTWAEWRASGDRSPAIFASTGVTPRPGLTARLAAALEHPRVAAATSYHEVCTGASAVRVAPLGASLESGWARNDTGGPCFAAAGDAADVVRHSASDPFRFWPAYAAMACADVDVALVPQCLYASAPLEEGLAAAESVAAVYDRHARGRLDLAWVLKYATAREAPPAPEGTLPAAGRGLYDHLLAIPDRQLEAFADLAPRREDAYIRDLRRLRLRLRDLAEEWRTSDPRVFVYGAGQHARLVLALEPELGRYVAGFVDRRPMATFLGKPCIRPDALSPAIADAVLYSSREHEREMHAGIAGLDLQHVLLYSESPPAGRDTTSRRLRRRLGGSGARIDALHAMYKVPEWVRGGCSHGDVEFLAELVTALQPGLVLELGVASGTSSAALLFALDGLPHSTVPRVLYSGDVRRTCYFDPARLTGAAVNEMYPRRRTSWVLDTDTDARRVRSTLPPGMVDFCFIDANHSHPWPLLDLLHVATLMRPEAWVALHDIELPRLHPQFQVHGPQWLFEAWPFNKIHGLDGSENIGAIQLPADLESIVPVALALLERDWEGTPTTWDVDLPDVFSAVSRAVGPRLCAPMPAAAAG